MAKRGVQLVILCEDLQQAVFARHYFMQLGFQNHEIRINKSPTGKGAGEQYVREQFPGEVRTYRSKSTYLSICLVVVIDADTDTVKQRLSKLDLTLADDGQENRQPQEKIAVFIPKRNIETWIHYLMGEMVDEQTDYQKLPKEGDCKSYVEKLAHNICPAGLPADAPSSLQTACDELQRIL